MTDSLPTVWNLEPHTRVKHDILRRYLQAWLPILTNQTAIRQDKSREILFIDGFAGPGEYANGEPGSPVIALQQAAGHTREFPVPVRMVFIEQREDRFDRLQQVIAPHLNPAQRSARNVHAVDMQHGDCDAVLNEILDQCQEKRIKFGPALAFLDQFGYGAVSMALISRILSFSQCEVFTYLSYKEMNRWISDPNKSDAFTRAFGGDNWQDCISLPGDVRRKKLLDLYITALRTQAGAKYVREFLMFDRQGSPLYWLLFCTNNLRGLEEMKKAMWYVDKNGEFRFSDRENPNQLDLLEKCFDQNWLSEEIKAAFRGRSASAVEVKEYVLAETPCYLFKAALKVLESAEALEVASAPPGRKPGVYPDEKLSEITLRFPSSLF